MSKLKRNENGFIIRPVISSAHAALEFESMPGEEWREFPLSKRYRVSNMGRVCSPRGRLLKQSIAGIGYLQVNLLKFKAVRVHRMVAFAFIPLDLQRPFVNHKDGNKTNNNVSNLEWCTQYENVQHSIKVLGKKPWLKTKSVNDTELACHA